MTQQPTKKIQAVTVRKFALTLLALTATAVATTSHATPLQERSIIQQGVIGGFGLE